MTVGFPGSMETPPFWYPFLFHVQHGEDGPWCLHTFWAVPYSTGDILGTVCKEMLQMSRGVASHHLANIRAATFLFAQRTGLLPHPQNIGWVKGFPQTSQSAWLDRDLFPEEKRFNPSPPSLAVGSLPSRRPGVDHHDVSKNRGKKKRAFSKPASFSFFNKNYEGREFLGSCQINSLNSPMVMRLKSDSFTCLT